MKEPLIKPHAVATEAFRDGMREARRSQWPLPLASQATKQTARKTPSLRVAVKCGVCVVALLGFVVPATTFVACLASIRILPATQFAEDLIRGSLAIALEGVFFHAVAQGHAAYSQPARRFRNIAASVKQCALDKHAFRSFQSEPLQRQFSGCRYGRL